MKWIVRLVLLAVAVAGARRLWDRQLAVQAALTDLDAQRRGIADAESELDALDRAIDASEARLRELDAKITSIEHEHPGGIPASIHPEYSRLVAEHNEAVTEHNGLVARHGVLRGEYKARVDRHNARVDDANAAERGMACSLLPRWLRPESCGASD